MKRILIMFFLLFTSSVCFAETSYNNLTPGKSTRADADRELGQPVKEHTPTLVEYKPNKVRQTKIYIQYRKNAPIVERIEIILKEPINHADTVALLHLPAQPSKSHTNANGNLETYYGAPFYMVLTYQGTSTANGIIRSGRYSRELYESASASIPQAQKMSAKVSSCFSSAPAVANTSRQYFYNWASQQSSAILEAHLKAKFELLFHCKTMNDEQLAKAFADISMIVVKYVPNAKCFNGQQGVVNTDPQSHYKWAKSQTREEMLNNLNWKVIAAMHCTDRQNDFFSDISLIVAKSAV